MAIRITDECMSCVARNLIVQTMLFTKGGTNVTGHYGFSDGAIVDAKGDLARISPITLTKA
jgi:hypothetical protein